MENETNERKTEENVNLILSKLSPTFWRKYHPLDLSKSEDYDSLINKFEVRRLLTILSVANREELITKIKNSESLARLLIFISEYLSGLSEYYSLDGYKKTKLTSAVESILYEDSSVFDNANSPILKALLLDKLTRQPTYAYDLDPSTVEFREKIYSQLKKRRRLVTSLHKSLDNNYTVEQILGDNHRMLIYIVRKKGKKIMPKKNKTVSKSNETERIILVDWDNNLIRIPKYTRKEISLFLSFFRFKAKIGIKKIEYSDSVNPKIPEALLDSIKEIKTQPVEELNSSIHLKSESIDAIHLDDYLRGLIKRTNYSKIKKLTVLKDGKKLNLRIISGNEFFFRPTLSRTMTDAEAHSFFGIEPEKKHLSLDPQNLMNEIIQKSLDNLRVRDYEHQKVRLAVDELQKQKILDFIPDQKRICINKDCQFRGEISYINNRKYGYRCPTCREITVFKEDVLTLIPNIKRMISLSKTKLNEIKRASQIDFDIIPRPFYFKAKKRQKRYGFIEICHPIEREKRLNVFFADKHIIQKVRSLAKSQIIPYLIVLIGPISQKDEREIKFSRFYLELVGSNSANYIKTLFADSQRYDKWREELIEEALPTIENAKNWGEFEDAVFINFQYLFPSSIKLGKMYTGKPYPDGFGRLVIGTDNFLFGWDAKFTKTSYNFNEPISKHYKYIDFLKRKGGLKHYLIIGNNLPEAQFKKVFLNRRKYRHLQISFISSALVKDFVQLIRAEGYNILDLDLRSRLLNVIFSKLVDDTNYLQDFSAIKAEIKQMIDEKKRATPQPTMEAPKC